jgi:hypothetical protein
MRDIEPWTIDTDEGETGARIRLLNLSGPRAERSHAKI